MKIWYQSYHRVGSDARFSYYEELFKRHAPKVVRPETKVDFHYVEKSAPKFIQSHYMRHLHLLMNMKKR